MAIRTYKYIGNPYPKDIGVLLPGVSVVQFPHIMTDIEIALLLDQFPHLRSQFEKGAFDDQGNPVHTGGGTGTGNETSCSGNETGIDFKPLSDAFDAEAAKINLLLNSISSFNNL